MEKNKFRYYEVDKSYTNKNIFPRLFPGDFSCLNVPLYTRNFYSFEISSGRRENEMATVNNVHSFVASSINHRAS